MAVVVHGLKELQSTMRRADSSFPRELRRTNKEAATTVFEVAEQHGHFFGGSTSKAWDNGSFRVFAEQRRSGIRIQSDSRSKFGLGAEFGSKQFRQFQPWTGSGQEAGYTVWPAIRAKQDDVLRAYEKNIMALLRRA